MVDTLYRSSILSRTAAGHGVAKPTIYGLIFEWTLFRGKQAHKAVNLEWDRLNHSEARRHLQDGFGSGMVRTTGLIY